MALVLMLVAGAMVIGLFRLAAAGQPLHHDFADKAAAVDGEMVDVISNMSLVWAFCGLRGERRRFDATIDREMTARRRSLYYLERLRILHASITEYVIVFGSPIGTEGYSGRFAADDYFIILEGEQWAYTEGELEKRVYKAGEMHHLARGRACGAGLSGDSRRRRPGHRRRALRQSGIPVGRRLVDPCRTCCGAGPAGQGAAVDSRGR